MNLQRVKNQPDLQLRLPSPDDAGQIAKLFPAPDVQRFLGLPPFASYTQQDAESFLQDSLQKREQQAWDGRAICLNDELIGMIDAQINGEKGTALLGFWLGKPYWGRGIMTDALRQFVQILFDDHPTVNLLKASVQEKNQASVRVFLRNGFIHEETRPRKVPQGAPPENLLVFGLRRLEERPN